MALRGLMSLVLVFVVAGSAGAVTYSGSVEYSAGTGSNEATIVVDFDLDNSFLFSYKWDGDATGWGALSAIDLEGALEVTSIDYGGNWGVFVSDLDYLGGSKYDYGEGANTGWAYYVSTDNANWSVSGAGVSFRTLSNGDWDSWVWSNYPADWSGPIRAPGEEPIPEPCTMVMLGLGGLLLRRRKM